MLIYTLIAANIITAVVALYALWSMNRYRVWHENLTNEFRDILKQLESVNLKFAEGNQEKAKRKRIDKATQIAMLKKYREENPEATNVAMADALGVSPDTIRRRLQEMEAQHDYGSNGKDSQREIKRTTPDTLTPVLG